MGSMRPRDANEEVVDNWFPYAERKVRIRSMREVRIEKKRSEYRAFRNALLQLVRARWEA